MGAVGWAVGFRSCIRARKGRYNDSTWTTGVGLLRGARDASKFRWNLLGTPSVLVDSQPASTLLGRLRSRGIRLRPLFSSKHNTNLRGRSWGPLAYGNVSFIRENSTTIRSLVLPRQALPITDRDGLYGSYHQSRQSRAVRCEGIHPPFSCVCAA